MKKLINLTMKFLLNFFLVILILIPTNGFTQSLDVLNGFKYIYVWPLTYGEDKKRDIHGIERSARDAFRNKGIEVISSEFSEWPSEAHLNKCNIAYVSFFTSKKPNDFNCGAIGIQIKNCNNEIIYKKTQKSPNVLSSYPYRACYQAWGRAVKNHIKYWTYNYNSSLNKLEKKSSFPEVENTGESEESLMSYYENNIIDDIEGIYKYIKDSDLDKNTHYKIGIKKYGYKYKAIIIESGSNKIWKNGEVKFILEPSAVNTIFSCKYFMGNKTEKETFCTVKNKVFLEIDVNTKDKSGKNLKSNFLKLYPSNIISSNNPVSQGLSDSKSWKGNGSGIIISKDGYLVSNNHVVENMNDFEVEFKYAQEIRSFHAKLVKTDPTNDLAILKIDDPNFKNFNSIPYNFYTRSADVGTEVFALGYPMALSVMGKDIKFTDGRISSKTGYMGNITTYQTTTPIQPGNSGGPLFDHKANLLGINSSGLRKDVADNVSYTIKTNYLVNLIDVLPSSIPLPSSTWISSKPLTEQIKILSNYVVLIKVR